MTGCNRRVGGNQIRNAVGGGRAARWAAARGWAGWLAIALAACGAPPAPGPTPGPSLDDYKDRMRDALNIPGVVFLDGDEVAGAVVAGLSDPAAEPAVRNAAAAAGVPAALVQVVATSPIVAASTLQDAMRPIKGGLQIFSSDQQTCTMTAVAFDRARAVKGLLTCSHCTRTQTGVDGTDFFQAGGGIDFVAREVIDPSLSSSLPGCPSKRVCRRSDAAFAEFTTSTVGIVGRLARPRAMCFGTGSCSLDLASPGDELVVTGVGGAPTLGADLHKIGRTTGWTTGPVTRTCVSANDNSNPLLPITMLCQSFVAAGAAHGDSGSPVFELRPNNQIVLMGIMWGVPTAGGAFVFSPIPNIEAEIGALDFL